MSRAFYSWGLMLTAVAVVATQPVAGMEMSDSFDSGSIAAGETYTWHAAKPGTYHYVCKIHAEMAGTLTVTAGDGMGKATEIGIQGRRFLPADVSVLEGSDVTWTNRDGFAHTVTSSPDAMMDSDDAMEKSGQSPGLGVPLLLLGVLAVLFEARRRA